MIARSGKPLHVECYAGGRDAETPRAVVLDGRRIEVAEVLERSVVEPVDGGGRRRVFVLRLEDGRRVRVEQMEAAGAWILA